MSQLSELMLRTTGLNLEIQSKLLTSILLILILVALRALLLKFVWKRTEEVQTRYVWRKAITYVIAVLALFLVGRIWFEGLTEVGTFLGLVSAGLAIALKDPVGNVAGWLFILARRPFTIGDRVQIGSHAGDVIDIRVFQFTLLEIGNWVDADQSTGRVIHIPNAKIFTEAQANYSKGFQYIWNEVPVLVTFESNWKKAKQILLGIGNKHAEHLSELAQQKVKEASRKFMIFYTQLTPTVYTSVRDSGVLLTIRYLCEPRRRRGSEQAIWEDILNEFGAQSDIDFAYPTQRFYHNLSEGKPGTRVASADLGGEGDGGIKT